MLSSIPPDENIIPKPQPPKFDMNHLDKEQQEKFMTEYIRLSARYVKPHNLKSKFITDKDLPRVMADGKDMVAMCRLPRGRYNNIAALAHPQIDDKKPLRFFALPNGMIVINPFIYDHTKVAVFKDAEGCMSYPDIPEKTLVPRYGKIWVKYQTLSQDGKDGKIKLGPFSTEELSGHAAHVFQHEVAHLNGHNVYDSDFDPKQAICLGDGILVPPQSWGEEETK